MNFLYNINQYFAALLVNYLNLITERSSCSEMFCKKDVLRVTTKTANHPKPPETIRNHSKPSETTQNFLQPTTNYLELAIISLKQPDTPNSQKLSAFGQFYHIKFWNYTQQSSLNRWRRMNILILIFNVTADIIIVFTTKALGNNSLNNLLCKFMRIVRQEALFW